jgi:hypothetical protein
MHGLSKRFGFGFSETFDIIKWSEKIQRQDFFLPKELTCCHLAIPQALCIGLFSSQRPLLQSARQEERVSQHAQEWATKSAWVTV